MLKTAAGTIGAAILRRQAEGERLQLVREQSARVEAEAAQRRLAFLAEASQVLALSLDFETTLQGVANLVVPALADWCCVDILEADGSIRRIAAAMGEPVLSEMKNGTNSPIDLASEHPVAVVMRTGRSLLSPQPPQSFGKPAMARVSPG